MGEKHTLLIKSENPHMITSTTNSKLLDDKLSSMKQIVFHEANCLL